MSKIEASMWEGKFDNFGGKDKDKSKIYKEQVSKLEKDLKNKEHLILELN